jgi:hypothetical protein
MIIDHLPGGMEYWLGKAKTLQTFVEQSPMSQGVK